MKKYLATSILFLQLINSIAQAPVKPVEPVSFTQGKVIYRITYLNVDFIEQVKPYMPTEMVLQYNPGFSKSEIKAASGGNLTLYNAKDGITRILMNLKGQNVAMKIAADEMAKSISSSLPPHVVQLTKETKKIAGVVCKMARVVYIDSAFYNMSFELYYTDRIKAKAPYFNPYKEIKGLPMVIQMMQNGMYMRFEAVQVIAEKTPDKEFITPEGYREIDQKEYLELISN